MRLFPDGVILFDKVYGAIEQQKDSATPILQSNSALDDYYEHLELSYSHEPSTSCSGVG